VTTLAATSVTGTGATLNGSANPNLAAATGWFRYSTVNPGICDDSFGTRAPASGGSSLGSGGSAVAYSQSISGLASGTTYYYCAIASNAAGTAFGTILSFTTAAAPSVTTVDASLVTSTGATLNGSANPNQLSATGWFRYSTVNPVSCNNSFGTRAPVSGGAPLGAGTSPVDYSQAIAGLNPGTTYYFCAIASNSLGTGFGSVLSFTTPAAPSVTTMAATAVSSTTATLNASANPMLADATGWFRYNTVHPGTCNDSFGTRAPASGGSPLGAGSTPVPYTEPITGLTPGTTYYYCAIADNAVGVGFGAVLSFTTTSAPSVTTEAATAVVSTTALLNGSANPNQTDATGWFRYDTTDPGACDDTFGTRAPAVGGTSLGNGSSPVAYAEPLTGLMPLTTYYYCAIAENAVGMSFGAVLSFTTSSAPMVTTNDATNVTSAAATLNGSADPNLSATTAWFRYDTVDPGTCDDTFGTRVPASGGTSVGAGNSPVDYSEDIAGLLPGTTYYFCAIASNQAGTSFGEVLSLTTSAEAPSVTTDPPTNVTSDSAVLNGSADPNGSDTTGWFRYDTTDPGACDDSFGIRAPAAGGAALGSGVGSVAYSEAITGLSPGVTYYYCAIAANSEGIGFGEVVSFVAGAAAPTVTTEAAADILGTSATIAGTATPNGSDTTGWFRYGDADPGTCDDSFGTRVPATGGVALGAGTEPLDFSQPLTGLEPNTTYYYCAAASNMVGGAAFGEVLSFTTPAVPPVVTTLEPYLGAGVVTLNGSANPMGTEATAWFRFDTVDPGACNDTFGTRAPSADGTALGAGNEDVAFSESLTDLPAGTYYVCAIAENDGGIAYGEVLTFATSGEEPTPPDSPSEEEGGCGCRVGAGRSGSMASLLALLLLAVRRRRRRA
jgi:MYXO-CTERM domain-containing protein